MQTADVDAKNTPPTRRRQSQTWLRLIVRTITIAALLLCVALAPQPSSASLELPPPPIATTAAATAAANDGDSLVYETSRPRANANGLLHLCPAGGSSFISAWQLTCSMKKRRKRSASNYASSSSSLFATPCKRFFICFSSNLY